MVASAYARMLDLAGPLHGPAISLNVCEGGVCK